MNCTLSHKLESYERPNLLDTAEVPNLPFEQPQHHSNESKQKLESKDAKSSVLRFMSYGFVFTPNPNKRANKAKRDRKPERGEVQE